MTPYQPVLIVRPVLAVPPLGLVEANMWPTNNQRAVAGLAKDLRDRAAKLSSDQESGDDNAAMLLLKFAAEIDPAEDSDQGCGDDAAADGPEMWRRPI